MNNMPQSNSVHLDAPTVRSRSNIIALLVIVIGAFIWSQWSVMSGLAKDWRTDEDYSVGQLVPLAACYVLWQARHELAQFKLAPCWWGVGLVVSGFFLRLYGLVYLFESIERYAMIVTIAGLVLLVGGRQLISHLKWLLLFLCLMIPLPGALHNKIAGPMQTLATKGAVFCLELTGSTALREGHTITLNGVTPLAVAEACSGLRMLTSFVVVGCVMAFMIRRPTWQRAAMVLSTVPVAIICNLIRLVATAYLFAYVDGPTAEKFFHDFAGYFMMPLAVALLMLELWLFTRLELPDNQRVMRTNIQLSPVGQ